MFWTEPLTIQSWGMPLNTTKRDGAVLGLQSEAKGGPSTTSGGQLAVGWSVVSAFLGGVFALAVLDPIWIGGERAMTGPETFDTEARWPFGLKGSTSALKRN